MIPISDQYWFGLCDDTITFAKSPILCNDKQAKGTKPPVSDDVMSFFKNAKGNLE